MRLFIAMILLSFTLPSLAKEFKMPCAEYEKLTGDKVCDISSMIPTSDKEITAIKQKKAYEKCRADFKAKYPQCFPGYNERVYGKRQLSDECYSSKTTDALMVNKICPNPNKPIKSKTVVETKDIWH